MGSKRWSIWKIQQWRKKVVFVLKKRNKENTNGMKKRKVFFVGRKRKKMNEKEDQKKREKN